MEEQVPVAGTVYLDSQVSQAGFAGRKLPENTEPAAQAKKIAQALLAGPWTPAADSASDSTCGEPDALFESIGEAPAAGEGREGFSVSGCRNESRSDS